MDNDQVTENSIEKEDVVVASNNPPSTSNEEISIESSQDMFSSQQSNENSSELDENTPLRAFKKAIRHQHYSKKDLAKIKDTMNIDTPAKKRNRNTLTPSPVSKINATPSKRGKTRLNFGVKEGTKSQETEDPNEEVLATVLVSETCSSEVDIPSTQNSFHYDSQFETQTQEAERNNDQDGNGRIREQEENLEMCKVCDKEAGLDTVECEGCQGWLHRACCQLSKQELSMLKKLDGKARWFCKDCDNQVTNLFRNNRKKTTEDVVRITETEENDMQLMLIREQQENNNRLFHKLDKAIGKAVNTIVADFEELKRRNEKIIENTGGIDEQLSVMNSEIQVLGDKLGKQREENQSVRRNEGIINYDRNHRIQEETSITKNNPQEPNEKRNHRTEAMDELKILIVGSSHARYVDKVVMLNTPGSDRFYKGGAQIEEVLEKAEIEVDKIEGQCLLFIIGGGNNLKRMGGQKTAESIIEGLQTLKMKNKGSICFVGILPRPKEDGTFENQRVYANQLVEEKIAEINAAEISSEATPRIIYLPIDDVIDNSLYNYDKIHLNRKGTAILGKEMIKVIKTVENRKPMVQRRKNSQSSELRHRDRGKNVVVYKIWESDSTYAQDRIEYDYGMATEMLQTLELQDVEIVDVRRLGQRKLGQPNMRPMIIELNSENDKWRVLSKSKLLKNTEFYMVYIAKDMTQDEIEKDNQLRQMLKERRTNGEQCAIKNGRIIPKKKPGTLQDFME